VIQSIGADTGAIIVSTWVKSSSTGYCCWCIRWDRAEELVSRKGFQIKIETSKEVKWK
jgi:hypothetical protein